MNSGALGSLVVNEQFLQVTNIVTEFVCCIVAARQRC